MLKKHLWLSWILLMALVVGCTPTLTPGTPPTPEPPTPTPALAPAAEPGRIVISELVTGVPGNNSFEFVELYNAGSEPVEVRGWTLWYRMSDEQDAQRVYRWTLPTEIPGYGHLLLVREGQDAGVMPDGTFSVPLFERQGGLELRDASGEPVDALAWGAAGPTSFGEGAPAPAPFDGHSIERLPGGEAGNAIDTGDNAADFVKSPDPAPQNRGSAIAPLPEQRLELAATAPYSVTPGTLFGYAVAVENRTGAAQRDVAVTLPLPEGFVMEGFEGDEGITAPQLDDAGDFPNPATWTVDEIQPGERIAVTLELRSPWRYGLMHFGGSYVEAPDWYLRGYGALVPLLVEGGAIPIATARELAGNAVTVEGVATMYTGGFYAGSDGTKFYLQDETGGIQVYCPGGRDYVRVRVGDRVRVTGEIEVYRDSVEIIPEVYPDDVEVLAQDSEALPALVVTAGEAGREETLLGQLIEVEGTVTRFEEFNFSYELDLTDERGDTVLVYLEKDTRVNPEFVDIGSDYRITGISEIYDAEWQLKPRREGDFVQVFPPELMLDVMAENSVEPGSVITYVVTAYNHTEAPLTDVHIQATPPEAYATVEAVLDGGALEDEGVIWRVAEISPQGGSATARFVVRVAEGAADRVVMPQAVAWAAEWPDVVESGPWATFVGSGVPIWALQGPGSRSPFVHSIAATEGVVTGVFPELQGFWMQSLEPDDDPLTSEGLYIFSGALDVTATMGSLVRVTGKVRESSGQTMLHLRDLDDLELLSADVGLPAPVELDPPPGSEASLYYEALEGMLVSVTEPAVAVAPMSQYGEFVLVRPEWGIERVMRGEPQGMLIFVDDGSDAAHADRATLPYAVKTGDFVGDLMGPLAFTYDNYKIQPIITPTVITTPRPISALAPVGENEVSLATFNVENLFDIHDPHPSSPPRPSLREYKLKLAKAAETLVAMGAPTIVGFQEVENVGVLEDLAEHPALAEYGYVPVLIEGFDSRGIDVGYLVRGDRATLEGASAHPAPEGLTSRPPLLITATVHLEQGDRTLYVLNNHFLSMSGGERATEPRRIAQAEWNAALVERLLAEHPGALVAVMGDLNSFYDSPPLDALRAGGLNHVYELEGLARPYTYIYQGAAQTLDHILVTPALFEALARVEVLHVNADYPPPLPDDASPERTSDHDPLVVVFSFD